MGFNPVSLQIGSSYNGRFLGVYLESIKTLVLDSLLKQVMQSQPTQKSVVDPLLSVPSDYNQSAALFNLSVEAQNISLLVNQLFDTPLLRGESLKLFMGLSQNNSDMIKPALALLGQMKTSGASTDELNQTIEFVNDLANVIKTQSVNRAVQATDIFAVQTLKQITAIVNLQKKIPDDFQLSPREVIQFFQFALKENLPTFEKELFALPIVQTANINPKDYLVMIDQVDPLKLALLLIHLKSKKSPDNMDWQESFVAELKMALNNNKPLKPIVDAWVNKSVYPKPFYPDETTTSKLRFIFQGLNWVSQGKERSVVTQALSPKLGALPDEAWKLQGANANLLSIQGGLFMTQNLGPGLHKLKFSVKGEEDDSLVDLFLYCVQGLSEEEEKQHNEESPHDSPQSHDQGNRNEEKMKSPFAGEISLKLVSPFVLTRPYHENEPVNAPLIVKFRFLADIVDPHTLFSRQQFLTLATSPKIKDLRQKVRALEANGLSAYDDYLAALNTLLDDVRGVFPQAQSTFERAQKFLRDEVLLYFMGKKSMVSYAPLQHAEKTAKGDVIASVCSATADLLTSSSRESDALVELVDASHWAQTKPQFITRIQQFFDALRLRMGEPYKQNTLALAQEFSERATIL